MDYLNSTKPIQTGTGELEYKVKSQDADYTIHAPVLEGYLKTSPNTPSFAPDDSAAFQTAGFSPTFLNWSESNPYFTVHTTNISGSAEVTVT